MGGDQENTRRILADLVNHPNAGGVLVLGLGCENSNIEELKKYIGPYNENRVKFLVAQECEDEIAEEMCIRDRSASPSRPALPSEWRRMHSRDWRWHPGFLIRIFSAPAFSHMPEYG